MKIKFAFLSLLAMAGLASPGFASTLDQVKARGVLNCGSNPGLVGFALQDNGVWSGLDVDVCRAVAAMVFNDAKKVKFIPLTAKDRYTALQSGEIDLLARNSTWTIAREAGLGLLFAAPNYYDGQGFMVRKKLNVASALELNGASICVQQGTTTELNVSDYFRVNSMKFESVSFSTADEAIRAYDTGRCDAFTTDSSQLYSERFKLVNPDEHIILPEIISKEPLTPVVRQGDDQWFNIVRWMHFAMLNAEEFGVSQKNVDDMLKSENPEIRRLLGVEGKLGQSLGLTDDWAYRVIKQVGNYGEVFDRNIGEGSRMKIKRGLNALWSKGGLQYGPPIH